MRQVLGPLPHVMPRCHGFDCTPEYLIIGGLVFCHLTCPMLHVKKQVRFQRAAFDLSFCDESLTVLLVLMRVMFGHV